MGEENKEQRENSYEFIKETIKEKPVNRKKTVKQLGRIAGAGAVFGLAAAIVFSLTEPHFTVGKEKKDENIKIQFSPEKEKDKKEEARTAETENSRPEAAHGLPQNTQTASGVQKADMQELTPDEYRKLYFDIFSTAEKAQKAMVTVIGSKNDKNWFQTPYESQISGLIVAESEQDYFIMTEYRIVENVDRIQVVFCDGTMADARFQKEDRNTGFAVLKIPKTGVPASTKESIGAAPLGASYQVKLGEPVLAIGSPMGYSDSVGYGIVTSVSNKVSKIDAEYGLLVTDIAGSSKGSGVICNLDGEIVAIIAQSVAREDAKNMIIGLPVSQIKELIKILTDESRDMIYMGIRGENITREISEKKGIPVGLFVEEVEVESPAMQVGIQNGDVIVELNGEKVETVREYQQKLQSFKAGETIKVKAMRQGTEAYVDVSFDVTLKAR